MAPRPAHTKPSRWWTAVAVATAALAVAASLSALFYQRTTSRPIGEGQLFLGDARAGQAQITALLATGQRPDEAVRHLRNALRIEGVALVDSDARITASTSESLVGSTLDNPVLGYALQTGRFGAAVASLDRSLQVDGVTEWNSGEALYQALLPGDPHSLLLLYDTSDLLRRRSRGEGIQSGTLQLLGIALLFAASTVAVLVGRSRALRRYREIQLEASYLRKESEALQALNAELVVARNQAEKALALAEEKNRIRSEFVLMINHELRTPLTSVVTGAELLRATGSWGIEEDTILDSMSHDGRRLQTMIDQLLALARVENRGLSLTPQRMEFGAVCRTAANAHSKVFHSGIGEAGHPALESIVTTDLQTLAQLVSSLVDNAYTHGASNVAIECRDEIPQVADLVVGERPSHAVYVAVRDDGPGIRPEFLPRAFEKFEKDSRSSGTGLGLYMARMMSEAIGSSLHVWTSPRGTTVAIAVPLVDVPATVGVA
ncbi:MAG TPA: HAMP domain-containing sensor histidine kinase [Acidimicrobiia bacterium]|nr:HAMP domain-containing sensor histidine kinase [Acidimicrobiia bacterium]